jgi:HSP20 family protein
MDLQHFIQGLSSVLQNADDSTSISSCVSSIYLSPIDVINDKNHVKVFVELPGIERKDITLDFFNNKLEITALKNRKYDHNDVDIEVKNNEITYGTIKRKITLPISVTKKENVEVVFTNGLLQITINKLEEEKNRFSL